MTSEQIAAALEQHRAWLTGTGGARADLRSADLRGADLSGADLSGANLSGANLSGADLVSAYLVSADLSGADLSGADLSRAYLSGADLSRANLSGADLGGANLGGADLRRADLSRANLSGAYLISANLRRADLSGTALDPAAPVPALTDEEIAAAWLKLDGPWVLGWRTARSVHVGSTVYAPGSVHVAPWFSVDAATPCHPGIYLASPAWLAQEFGGCVPRVRCRALRAELVHAGDKWRARRLWIAREDGSWPEVAP